MVSVLQPRQYFFTVKHEKAQKRVRTKCHAVCIPVCVSVNAKGSTREIKSAFESGSAGKKRTSVKEQ